MFFFYSSGDPRDLHSFPTRRSSDLEQYLVLASARLLHPAADLALRRRRAGRAWGRRSEEHTSELQSRGHLVCRLLLEKKKPRLAALRTNHGMLGPCRPFSDANFVSV